jgi:hypothetical protein
VRSGFSGAMITTIVALALPGVGTSDAHLDPNRYGVRTVKAAGGSVTDVTVSFTVRPVIAVVVDAGGRPLAVWSNLGHAPTAAQLAALHVRRGSVHGRELQFTTALRASTADALDAADWSRRGQIWAA